MTADQLWAGVDVGKEHHWVAVVDDTGAVVLSRKLVNDERSVKSSPRSINWPSRCPGRWT
jgi:Transposase